MAGGEEGFGLDDLVLEAMEQHGDASQLPEGVQAALADAEISAEAAQEATSVLGLTVESGASIKKNIRLNWRERLVRKMLGGLRQPGVRALASALPERFTRPNTLEDRSKALAEVLSVACDDADVGWFERAGLRVMRALAPDGSGQGTLEKNYRALFVGVADKVMHTMLRNTFFELSKTGTPEDIARLLKAQEDETGIVQIVNYVVEASKTPEEARRVIDLYKALIGAGVRAVAVKPTGVVHLSTSEYVADRNTPKLADALHEVMQASSDYAAQINEVLAEDEEEKKPARVEMDSEWSGLMRMQVNAMIEAAKRPDTLHVPLVIALQAYDARAEEHVLRPLMEISRQRVAMGGVPITFRLVCGANLLDEEYRKSANGWENTPMVQSEDGEENARAVAHANYQRLLSIMAPEIAAGNVGVIVASMNFQTQAWSMNRLAEAGVFNEEKSKGLVGMATLRGMLGREMFAFFERKYGEAFKQTVHLSEYVPSAKKSREDLVHGLAYNTRRTDEIGSWYTKMVNGAKKVIANWVGTEASTGVGSDDWLETQVKNGLLEAMRIFESRVAEHGVDIPSLGARGERETWELPESIDDFNLIPRLDLRSEEDVRWMYELMDRCFNRTDADVEADGLNNVGLGWEEPNGDARETLELKGRTRPDLVLGRFEMATQADIDKAFELAKADPSGWNTRKMNERAQMILDSAASIRGDVRERLDMSLILNVSKTVAEAEGEVDEAIEMALMHVLHQKELARLFPGLNFGTDPDNGVTVEICPKNFPNAIPYAHITASLLAGNRVIVKPSGGEDEETLWATYEVCKTLWDAGVPKDVLIWLPCNNENAAYLSSHPDCKKIGFTGSTNTANIIWGGNFTAEMAAETGGRNIVVLDSSVNLKEFAHQIVYSIVNFGGQKCSKPIAIIALDGVDLELLRKEIYGMFKYLYVGAPVGPEGAVDRSAVDCTPLAKRPEPGSPLYRDMTELRPGESWLFNEVPDDPEHPKMKIVTDMDAYEFPGIEEIFGPICTLIPIKGGIDQAVDMIASLKGTLTGALWSDDAETIAHALKNWETGQLKVNGKSTGALASAQFGDGVGDAHRGVNGAPTGSPEFVMMKAHMTRTPGTYPEVNRADVRAKTAGSPLHRILDQMSLGSEEMWAAYNAGWSCLHEYERYFSKERRMPHSVKGETNWVESKPVGRTLLRITERDSMPDALMKLFAAVASGNPLTLNAESGSVLGQLEDHLGGRMAELLPNVLVTIQSGGEFIQSIKHNNDEGRDNAFHHITFVSKESASWQEKKAAAEAQIYMDWRPATGYGRVDMIPQFRVQSYTVNFQKAGDTIYPERRFHAAYGKQDVSPEEQARVWKDPSLVKKPGFIKRWSSKLFGGGEKKAA